MEYKRYMVFGIGNGSEDGAHSLSLVVEDGNITIIDGPNESNPKAGTEFGFGDVKDMLEKYNDSEHENVFLGEYASDRYCNSFYEELAVLDPERGANDIYETVEKLIIAREEEVTSKAWYFHTEEDAKSLTELEPEQEMNTGIVGPYDSEFEALADIQDEFHRWEDSSGKAKALLSEVFFGYVKTKVLATEVFTEGGWEVSDAWREHMEGIRK